MLKGLVTVLLIATFVAFGIVLGDVVDSENTARAEQLMGTITIDGSSTVFPLVEAAAESFRDHHPGVQTTIRVSGSSGGLARLIRGEVDIANASRQLTEDERRQAIEAEHQLLELPLAFDGITVVVPTANDFVDRLDLEQLTRIWTADPTTMTWRDIDPTWPDRPIVVYGPGPGSGTRHHLNHVLGARNELEPLMVDEDDYRLTHTIISDRDALGMLGHAYWSQNRDHLRRIPIDMGEGPVLPSRVTIGEGSYTPLVRQLYVYVDVESLRRPAPRAFLRHLIARGPELVDEIGYVPLPRNLQQQVATGLARQLIELDSERVVARLDTP
ncbi:MAG: phosphate ABC transporter substrate-binding protein PstS family protein [Acidobacteriota bacterium]